MYNLVFGLSVFLSDFIVSNIQAAALKTRNA